MALLLAESIVISSGFDPADQLRRYLSWYRDGHLGSNFNLIDIGIQTRMAVLRFEEDQSNSYPSSSDEKRSGNGSLMRLAPVAIGFHRQSREVLIEVARNRYALLPRWYQPHTCLKLCSFSSRTTHGAVACVDACRVYAAMMVAAIEGASKESLLSSAFFTEFCPTAAPLSSEIALVVAGSYKSKAAADIEVRNYDTGVFTSKVRILTPAA